MNTNTSTLAPSKLTREDWISAARSILIDKGISSVRVRGLSAGLGVTTGAFYWLYDNLEALHSELRSDWEISNTDPFTKAVKAAGPDGWDQYLAIGRVIMFEEDYDPAYDNAIRSWAHVCTETAEVLEKIDLYRIDLAEKAFKAMGFKGNSAQIRARVHYYHQVGYQAMRIQETIEERMINAPYYTEIISGDPRLSLFDGPDALREMYLKSRNINK